MSRRPKRIDPGESANCTRATKQKQQRQFTSIVREISAILLAALIFSASVWTSVFGMAADLASWPMVPMSFNMAEVTDGR